MTPEPEGTRPGALRPVATGAWLVVVNYGSHELLEQNFSTHVPDGGPVGGMVVVDNFSSAQEESAVAEVCASRGWTLVARPTNGGFAAACNDGVRAAAVAGARNVVLVNPDAVVAGVLVEALGCQLDEDPMTLVSPTMVTSSGAHHFRGSRVRLRDGQMRGRSWDEPPGTDPVYLSTDGPERDWLTGACLGFSVELWERAGGLDERYFLYWEDVDFSQRCAEAGARLSLRRDLVAVHDEGATHGAQGSRARSALYYYYNCRNRLLYAGIHLSRLELLRWIWSTPAQSWQILLRGGRRQLVESSLPLRAAVQGSLAGLLSAAPALFGRPVRPSRFPRLPTG